jgi:hypothetical protein
VGFSRRERIVTYGGQLLYQKIHLQKEGGAIPLLLR